MEQETLQLCPRCQMTTVTKGSLCAICSTNTEVIGDGDDPFEDDDKTVRAKCTAIITPVLKSGAAIISTARFSRSISREDTFNTTSCTRKETLQGKKWDTYRMWSGYIITPISYSSQI